jgi:hypothetical protein
VVTNSDDRRPVYIDGFATNYDALVGPLAFLALVGGADQPSVKPRRTSEPRQDREDRALNRPAHHRHGSA